ncbi:hypothetical protein Bpfe_024999 [Biomphalaria pfeifferi]|uniref:Uncharacterized protein n=1 Tax=Biomphalaria pfeifferi TaxID=112525 RepID=A0AAD8EZW6_BIOPF|nr:hypothetical protein Bpfe_024999 [Biomphalaria pfeifferi]
MASRKNGILPQWARTVKNEIQDFLQSGNYYVTEELAKEVSVINNELDHLSLDDTFLTSSKDWQSKPGNFTPSETSHHYSGALNAINKVGANLRECKFRLSNKSINGKQENQLRELHQWAVSCLKNAQQELEPFTFDAADRIKQFGDSIGVTDRYTGYRNNLSRNTRDPFKMNTTWMDKGGELGLMNNLTRSHTTLGSPSLDQRVMSRSMRYVGEPTTQFSEFGGVPPANIGALKKQVRFGQFNPPMRVTRGYRTIDSLYPKSTAPLDGGQPRQSSVMDEVKTLNALNACAQYDKIDKLANSNPQDKKPYELTSAQEQAGINTNYPGRTEYMLRYTKPERDMGTTEFKINPSPDFSIYGRPMQTSVYHPSITEYQARYDWPSCDKIVRLPWLRN